MEQLAIKPDYRAISDFSARWLAFREGPFARDCLESICDDALVRSDASRKKARGLDAIRRQFADQAALHWLELSLAAATAYDSGSLDAFEDLLWGREQ